MTTQNCESLSLFKTCVTLTAIKKNALVYILVRQIATEAQIEVKEQKWSFVTIKQNGREFYVGS